MITCCEVESATGMDCGNLAEAVRLLDTDYMTCVTSESIPTISPLPHILVGYNWFVSSIPRSINSNTVLALVNLTFILFLMYAYGLLLWTKLLAFIKILIFQKRQILKI